MGAQHTPGPEGCASLRHLGLDHFHMEEWECTYNHDQLDLLEEEIVSSREPWGVHKIHTLINGPTLFAARVPIDVDEDGDAHDYDLRFYASREEAEAAIAKAKGKS